MRWSALYSGNKFNISGLAPNLQPHSTAVGSPRLDNAMGVLGVKDADSATGKTPSDIGEEVPLGEC